MHYFLFLLLCLVLLVRQKKQNTHHFLTFGPMIISPLLITIQFKWPIHMFH